MTEIVCSRDTFDKTTGTVKSSTWGVLKVWMHANRVCWDWDSASGSGPFSVDPDRAVEIGHEFIRLAIDIRRLQRERAKKGGEA